MTEYDIHSLELSLPTLDEAELAIEIARWRGHVLRTLEDMSPVMTGLAALLTERLCRRLQVDYPSAQLLRCRPERTAPAAGAEAGRAGASGPLAVLVDPWTSTTHVLTGTELLDASGNVLGRLPSDHPAQHWLGLLTPMVGAEPVLCLLDERAWKFRTIS